MALGASLIALVFGLAGSVRRARARTLPSDPSFRVSGFIAGRSQPADRIFVWGYHPDIYLFADRRPASRFVYGSFLTGLIPWTNCDPARDTAYAIVPGAMQTLLQELEANRPVFIVDCSAGPNRHWDKYPLEKFPLLAAFLQEHYAAVENEQFIGQGFRLLAIKDSYRRVPPGAAPAPAAQPARPGSVAVFAPPFLDAKSAVVRLTAEDTSGRLQRLELLLDGAAIDGISLSPATRLVVDFAIPRSVHPGVLRLQARATCADGAVFLSPVRETNTQPGLLPRSQLGAFILAESRRQLIPSEATAPFGASASVEEGRLIYSAHAPSRFRYNLPGQVLAVRGGHGFRPGAYAPENPHPTDGAEFRVDWLAPDGRRTCLYRHLMLPGKNPADRTIRPFQADLPPGATGQIEFVIDPGPAGDVSSDWTFWADLTLETCR